MKKILVMVLVGLMLVGCSNSEAPQDIKTEIKVYTRDASSGTREAFETAAQIENLTVDAIEVSGNGDMATKVGNDANAIGYVSLTTDFAANGITPLKFDGVEATESNAVDGSYKLQRPFNFVTRATGDFNSDETEQLVLAFVDYLQNSKEGMLVVQSAGGIVDLSKGVAWAELAENHPIVNQDNSHLTITTGGSTSVEKSIKAALESFVPYAGNFNFTMNHTGSSDGFKRVLGDEKDGANAADIGFASRGFKDTETVDAGAVSGAFCIDAVVTVVNDENTIITDLTQAQLKGIFESTIVNYEDVK